MIWSINLIFWHYPALEYIVIPPPQKSLCRVRRSVGRSVRLYYCVRSISPIPIEGFSSNLAEMFTSTRGCAEPMLPKCQLKVNVTIEGQTSNNQILDNMSCPLCKSYTNWKIFFNLGSNVHLVVNLVSARFTGFFLLGDIYQEPTPLAFIYIFG